MKRLYETPEIEMISFTAADEVTGSTGTITPSTGGGTIVLPIDEL